MDVLVVGAGGNGQTYFMQFLNKNKIITNKCGDEDRLKHASCPSKIKNKNIKKCIFIYNEPMQSIMSHYRRGWAAIQMRKLGNPQKLSNPPINKLYTLTIDENEDVFGIKHQFDNWINADVNYPILFLNFTDILESKDILNKFIGKNLNYSLFEKRSRNSSIKNDVNPLIIKIYADLYDYIKINAEKKNLLLK